MTNCFDVANYFLSLTEEDAGDSISNLKLQKLVYYAQGFNLAILGNPIFQESIEAWTHGPVIPVLYHHYKDHGAGPIPVPKELDFTIFSGELKELLDEVYSVYGQYSAWKLRDLTHEEAPWKNYYNKPDRTIPHSALKEYFVTRIKN